VVLIDQHAADERIRVEMFLEELCGDFLRGCVKRRELVGSDAKKVLLTRLEVEKIEDVGLGIKDAFERWGVRIGKMEGNKRGEEYVQVLVESVPDVVGDKVRFWDQLI
jgi:DNA mismatch repair protein MLH3